METLSPELYAAILSAAPDVVIVVDDAGRMIFVNNAVQALLGHRPGELVGQLIEALIPASQRDRHRGQRATYQGAPSVRHMGTRMDIVGLHTDGREIALEVSLSPVVADGRRYTICIARDATERRQMMAQLRELSHRDALTGLFSRLFFDTEVARLDTTESMPVACFVFDVDALKAVNDNRGHAAGDELIRRAANLLRGCLRNEDMLARIGGDEFAVLIPGMDEAGVLATAARVHAALDSQVVSSDSPMVSVSFGWAVAEAPPISRSIRLADERMYEAKRARPARSTPDARGSDRRRR